MGATSRLAEGLLARAPDGAVACKAGCDHCCYQIVGVTAPEALAIFDHLSQTASDPELEAVSARVAASRARTRGLSAAERFSPDHPCPFLEAGRCSIYEVRPLACRGMNSLDAGECETRLRDPDARAAFLATNEGGHSFMEPIRAFHAVSAGLQVGLSELYNLDMRALDLTAAMDLLLNGDESIPADWIGTRHPFEAARTDDDDPALRKISGVTSGVTNTPGSSRAPALARERYGASETAALPRFARERLTQPAAVISVISPGFVIPPDDPVPSNWPKVVTLVPPALPPACSQPRSSASRRAC